MAFTPLHTNGFESQSAEFPIEVVGSAGKAGAGALAISTTTGLNSIEARGGKACLKASGGEAALKAASSAQFVASKAEEIFWRFYVFIDKAPGEDKRSFISLRGTGDERQAEVRVSKNGTISFVNGAAAAVEPEGSLKECFSFGVVHRVEMMLNANETAAKATFKFRLDGTTLYENAEWSSGNFAPTGYRVGWLVSELTAAAYFDDIVVGKGEFPGPGVIVNLHPVADKGEHTGWTGGAGGATELWKAVDNTPPEGKETATNESQIINSTSTTVQFYEAECKSYTEAGVETQDEVKNSRAIANIGNMTEAVARSLGITGVSNPVIAEVTGSTAATKATNFSTGWLNKITTALNTEAITKGTKPVIKLRKNIASTNKVSSDYMALIVEYLPKAPAGTAQTPRRTLLGVGI